jgi:hypothetical protein
MNSPNRVSGTLIRHVIQILPVVLALYAERATDLERLASASLTWASKI